MKASSAKFVDSKGKPWPLIWRKGKRDKEKADKDDSIGFFALWRHASCLEISVTLVGVLLSWCSALCNVCAILVYGELTALFVVRHKASTAGATHAPILKLFNGGERVAGGNRSEHLDALVQDSVAFASASAAILCSQVVAAGLAVTAANWAADSMSRRIRLRVLSAALSMEAAFHDTTDINIGTALAQDTECLREGTGEHVTMTSYLGGCVVLGAAVSLMQGWLLTLVALAVVPLSLISAALVAKIGSACASRESAAYAVAGRGAGLALANVATVRAYQGEDVEVTRFDSALDPVTRAARRRGLAGAVGAALGWLSTYSLSALVLAAGAALCVRDMDLPPDQQEYHPGALVTILFCTFMCCQDISLMQPHVELFSVARGSARTLYRLLARTTLIDAKAGGVRPDNFRGDIHFKDVYFNYPSRPDVKVLRGLSLSVSAGETVALVGGSGCGKSTLLQLLQRMYDPDAGTVTVDGHALHSLDLHHYRTSIGIVGQEPVLFSGTLHENIALGIDAKRNDVIRAAQAANAHQFISKLPNGYDTVIGERGAALSGGQKQRVAIARALLRKPAVLLLDEPTSALDPAAERVVQAALDAASAGRTTLVVSHRLSTIVNATRIVYIEQGCVLEQGSHQELMALQGAYYKLVQADSQAHSTPMPALAEDDEDDVIAADEVTKPAPLQRSMMRQSTRASLTSQSCIRSSGRFAAPLVALPDDPEQEECMDEQEEDVPNASTWTLLRLCAPEWPLLVGGAIAAILVGAAMPGFAFLFSRIYGMFGLSSGEEILSSSRLHAGLFGAAAVGCALAAAVQGWLLSQAGAKLTHRLRVMLFRNYLVQEQGWFESPRNAVGALCARLAADCGAVHGATGARLGTVLQGASTMALGVALALPYSWSMTLVSLLSVPCVIGAIYCEGWVSRRSAAARRGAMEQAARVANEGVANFRTVHALGVESVLVSRYAAALETGAAAARGTRWARGVAYGLCCSAPTLGYAVSLAYGGWLIARRGLPYDHAILVSEALIYGAWMVAEALSFAPSFASAKRAGAKILQALARKPLIVSEETAADDPDWRASGALQLQEVSFSYPSRSHAPVLSSLSLSVPAGQSVALVGRSGCGKSTVLQLLMRSYDPDRGNVTLDALDTRRALSLRSLRRQMSLVQQEPALFERSIRDNIAYGDNSREVDIEEIIEVAQQANVHSFIASLPQGYDTILTGGGAALSGGQKQRVAIARALLRKPAILLLDEATSALDVTSEQLVCRALRSASAGRTTVTVAHRLATIRHCDNIALIDNGVVVEYGPHEELVKLRGAYWELLREQEGAQ